MFLALCGCNRRETAGSAAGKLPVVATIFPVYDFVRAVGGDRVEVTLLLPPGADTHTFAPRPADMARISHARLFVFTSTAMEPWAPKLLAGAAGSSVKAVDASRGIDLRPAEGDDHDHGEGRRKGGLDPHIWLDLDNARQMVSTIASALTGADPAGARFYEANAAAYGRKLQDLDARYRAELAACRSRTLVQGGHAAFGYLAARYGLTTVAAMGVSADSEPTPRQVAHLVDTLKRLPVPTVFSEEMISPRLAQVLADEAGAGVRRLHAGHTVAPADLQGGVTFLTLMERNLAELREGLACR